ncbi:hypothetical protein [Hydrogenophaga sp. BPS33]|uniref:hypothetical protein n=1 Tax=Hydrogenophaga sp. BPS33 TaxID=2651974 RepID=UPI00131F63A4|nr:hypothetical protein [Hydrogenophaga sp. BPS33]QHE85884.1 hypothetical protein F9K07_13710 [Hydrogenophaga sp. BPS33]
MGHHLIDCHVLTLPRFDARWVAELRSDLDREPVNQHWMPGIDGDLAASRVAGFSAGSAPFVSSADPDDRIMPGTYAALLQALQDNPTAPFAWAGEQMVDEHLKPWPMRPHVWAGGYDPVSHVCKGVHVHGVKLYRREVVMPVLDMMSKAGQCCEFLLDLAIAKPWTNPNRSTWPVHVPMVGRQWRQHAHNGFRSFGKDDFDRMAQVLGFQTMDALRDEAVRVCLPTSRAKA